MVPNEEFLRQWTNGGLLIDMESGRALTGDMLSPAGRPDQYAIWEEQRGHPALYDPETLGADNRAAFSGRWRVPLAGGSEAEARPAFDLFNVRFPKPPTNDVEARNLLSPEQTQKRLGYAERPLGPTHTGKVQAYEVYKAILTGKPYPVRGFLSFGGDIILSNGDTQTGRRALQALDLYVQTEFYETPAARYADFLRPAPTSISS